MKIIRSALMVLSVLVGIAAAPASASYNRNIGGQDVEQSSPLQRINATT
jgi:hypothetical protein